MPQCGIGDFGSSSEARAKERYDSSWLKPKRSTTPWSKYFWASAFEVRIGCRCAPIPEKRAGSAFGAAGVGPGGGGAWANTEQARRVDPARASRMRRIGASFDDPDSKETPVGTPPR